MKTVLNEYDEEVPCERATKYHFHLSLTDALNWPKPQFKKLLAVITKTDGSRFPGCGVRLPPVFPVMQKKCPDVLVCFYLYLYRMLASQFDF